MGFDLHVCRFRHRQEATVSWELATGIFMRGWLHSCDWINGDIEYEDSHGEVYMDRQQNGETTGFMLTHFAGRTILERLFEYLDVTGSLLVFSCFETENWLAVTDQDLIDHLPDDFRLAEYPPVVIRDVDHMIAVLRGRD
ncbi:hypothetical protein [Telmatospirillum sp.]|uniref:hypothetical protein n=1 Tax=Telmatospirillum sp. TaxID=2079197 RepID=UPI00284C897B|nr:hypothetical protein [Telmatospirillum sp.]MDR3435446.1 hypothetical protein [Telmatospirillum sp.]